MCVLCWGKCKQGSQVAKTHFRELSDRGGGGVVIVNGGCCAIINGGFAIVDGGVRAIATHPGPTTDGGGGGGSLRAWSDFREIIHDLLASGRRC